MQVAGRRQHLQRRQLVDGVLPDAVPLLLDEALAHALDGHLPVQPVMVEPIAPLKRHAVTDNAVDAVPQRANEAVGQARLGGHHAAHPPHAPLLVHHLAVPRRGRPHHGLRERLRLQHNRGRGGRARARGRRHAAHLPPRPAAPPVSRSPALLLPMLQVRPSSLLQRHHALKANLQCCWCCFCCVVVSPCRPAEPPS